MCDKSIQSWFYFIQVVSSRFFRFLTQWVLTGEYYHNRGDQKPENYHRDVTKSQTNALNKLIISRENI